MRVRRGTEVGGKREKGSRVNGISLPASHITAHSIKRSDMDDMWVTGPPPLPSFPSPSLIHQTHPSYTLKYFFLPPYCPHLLSGPLPMILDGTPGPYISPLTPVSTLVSTPGTLTPLTSISTLPQPIRTIWAFHFTSYTSPYTLDAPWKVHGRCTLFSSLYHLTQTLTHARTHVAITPGPVSQSFRHGHSQIRHRREMSASAPSFGAIFSGCETKQ